jgi:alcohol dehydrogenase YqhD (iron-dependent ADH family)
MNNFIFNNPTKIIFGKDTIKQIGTEIKKQELRNVLLLAGGGSIKKNGVYDQAIMSLKESGLNVVEYWGVQANPILSHTLNGVKICKENNIDCILAIGGGSVLDEAKAIGAGCYIDNLWSAFAKEVPVEKSLPVFAILTLSGTGSEMNGNAVVTNEETRQKWFIGSICLYPKVSIIDPSVQQSLPWNQTVNGGIDAISHTMEFYSLGTDEEMFISLDEAIVNTIIKSLDTLKSDNSDYSARANLCWAATIALNGMSGAGLKGGDWAVHRIEHGVSAIREDVAHGAGLAIIYPAWIKYNYHLNEKHFLRWSQKIWGTDSIDEAIEKMKTKYKSWGAPVTLSEIGITREQLPIIAEKAIEQGEIGNLNKLNYKEVMEILDLAF